MESVIEMLGSVELWMGLSLVAMAIPGPQNRLLPALFRGFAKLAGSGRRDSAE